MPSNQARPLVLLVEDSEDDAFFFRWTLDKCGFDCEVVHAADGAAAIQHLEAARSGSGGRPPDLIFLDLKIPTFTGFEVLAWIRDQHFEPPLDVAVLSGSEHASDIQRAHLLGASGYYVKPLSIEQLRTRFQSWQARQETQGAMKQLENHALVTPSGTA
jgi:CheY-like chemotaxis protein